MFEDLVDNVDLSWALNDKMRKENRSRVGVVLWLVCLAKELQEDFVWRMNE
eukprot:m.74896 g.74896  ORF g.74896 m.74896 type:complete len:51 (-) comp8461_c0_seq15:1334-1486(-)